MSTRALLYWVALVAGAEGMVRGHLANQPLWFHGGAWLLCAALAVTAWRWRRDRAAAVLPAALALGVAGLSVQALAHTPGTEDPDPLLAFWAEHAADRAQLLQPPRERSDAELLVFGQRVALDPRGFRAAPAPEPGSFRIVALGDANTFGATLGRRETPWPELLERAIGERLRCAVPVRVINAGVPGRRFAGTVDALARDVFPLDPDVLVVYPNPEQLVLLAREVPGLALPDAEPLPTRLSQPLQRLERWLRGRRRAAAFAAAQAVGASAIDVRPLPLAGGYRRLIVDARGHGADVVLVPLALALPPDASEAAIRRHEAVEPRTRQLLAAAPLHARLLATIGAPYRAAFADLTAGPGPGDPEAFLDLWLLSQRGRAQLADAVLEALRPRLAASPRPGCATRAQSPSGDGGNRAINPRTARSTSVSRK